LEIGAQNCQSLNISTKNKKTDLKINALQKKNCDILFLSDTRLNSEKQSHAVFDLEKKLLSAGYDFIYNSRESSRGVAILISRKLNYTVVENITRDAKVIIL
jgi:exonuclease III